VFDRALEISRAGARIVPAGIRILIVEGNYLLLQDPPWNALRPLFDLTVMITEPRAALEQRLLDRWRSHGIDEATAQARVSGNDLPNVDHVLAHSNHPDMVIGAGPAAFSERAAQ
jgi:pantothenate kinase